MEKDKILIQQAVISDMPVIELLAKGFDLDIDELHWDQFIVAKKNSKIIGFGRLRLYAECTEIATVGVIATEQKKRVGSLIVNELIRTGPPEIFVTCVIPDFFNKLGFRLVKQYPSVLQKKVDFCKSYDFSDEQIFVMKVTK